MPIERRFYVSTTNSKFKDKSPEKPNFWFDAPEVSSWSWKDTNETEDTSYFYSYDGIETGFVQYGQNMPKWGSIKCFSTSINLEHESVMDDNSIEVIGNVTLNYQLSRKTSYASGGIAVIQKTYINNILIHTYNGLTTDEWSEWNPKVEIFSEVIPAQEYGKTMLVKTERTYPNGEYTDSTVTVGVTLFNTNPVKPKVYVPMAIRKEGNWKDLNTEREDGTNGKIFRRDNTYNFIDISIEQLDTARLIDKGQNRIRKSENWRQLPPMIGGEASST